MNLAPVRAKANAHYICQECGSTELIQAHHEIPSDDESLIVLCAECHSRKHPNLPKALFFNKGIQPYWHNKSASSLAKELGVHPRTVIRAAKSLEILPGELTAKDERQIRKAISLRNSLNKKGVLAPQARKRLGLSRYQLEHRIELGIFPKPTFVDTTGVRYFDENWVRIAEAILENIMQREAKNEKTAEPVKT